MFAYAVRRILSMIPIIFGVTLVIFLLLNVLPGNPARVMAGPYATQAVVDSISEQMGFNRPLYVQFGDFLLNLLKGDLGRSYISRAKVSGEIWNVFPRTLLLAVVSTIFSTGLGIALGIAAALNRGNAGDRLVMVLAVLGLSMPAFLLGLIMQIIFSIRLDVLPPSGYGLDYHLIMPVMALVIPSAGWMARVVRSTVVDILPQDFVRTLRARGLPERIVIWKHVLKSALVPVISLVGTDFTSKLGGIIIIECIFSWPGLGQYGYNALFNRDLPALEGTVIVLTICVCLVNLIVDLLYAFIDKRIEYR